MCVCVWKRDPGSVLLYVCVRRQQCWSPRSADKHHIHKSRAEEGGETLQPPIYPNSCDPSQAFASINHWNCYTMVIPKTISMITRTNKISNCYHPSHLPPLKAQGGEGRWWMGEPFIGLPLPLRSKGLASEMMVKN